MCVDPSRAKSWGYAKARTVNCTIDR